MTFLGRKSVLLINHFYVAKKATQYREIMAITSFKLTQGHPFWYQSKAHMQLPISDYRIYSRTYKSQN